MRKRSLMAAVLVSIALLNVKSFYAQDVIDVVVQGISDGVKNTKQIDRDEAIMDAKLKAIERSGVDITSVTTVENFQLKKDWIESKAKASILPGFQIVEVGYANDGLYHVVLSCKVTTTSKLPQTNDNPAGIEWVFVKGSTFKMGDTFGDGNADERPLHRVTVSDFYIAKTEVTVAQYRAFCNVTDRTMPSKPSWGWKENNPIVNVSWDDVDAFCDWVGGRLPTEAEWEYAARGGSQSRGYKYSGSHVVDDVAWYVSNSGKRTQSVGRKTPNELGLYDMSGNVWERCSDWYGEGYYKSSPSLNPQGPSKGSFRVLRGGGWSSYPEDVRAADRGWSGPFSRGSGIGFRPAR
jgi:sulfatase modifying factor 1